MSRPAPRITAEQGPKEDHGQASGSGEMSLQDKQVKLKSIFDVVDNPELKPFITAGETVKLSNFKNVAAAANPNEREIEESLKKAEKLAGAIRERQENRKYSIESMKNLLEKSRALIDRFDQKRYRYIKPAVKSCLKKHWEDTNAWLQREITEPAKGGKTKKELKSKIDECAVLEWQLYTLFELSVRNVMEELSSSYLSKRVEETIQGALQGQQAQEDLKETGGSRSSSSSSSSSSSRSESGQHDTSVVTH